MHRTGRYVFNMLTVLSRAIIDSVLTSAGIMMNRSVIYRYDLIGIEVRINERTSLARTLGD